MKYLPHLVGLYIAKRLCDYLLRKTERIAANSLGELVLWAWRRWIKPKGNTMAASKTITAGPLSLTVAQTDQGVAKAQVALSLKGALGGGQAAGALQGALSVSGEVDLEETQLIDLGVGALEATPLIQKSPLALAALEALKAELEKVLAPAPATPSA